MIEKISAADTLFIPLEKQTLTNSGIVTKEVVRIADDTLSFTEYMIASKLTSPIVPSSENT